MKVYTLYGGGWDHSLFMTLDEVKKYICGHWSVQEYPEIKFGKLRRGKTKYDIFKVARFKVFFDIGYEPEDLKIKENKDGRFYCKFLLLEWER